MKQEQIVITTNEKETEQAGFEFAQTLKPGDVVCLYGDLGAGKTTFTKGVAKGLGIESRIISPTFSLVRQHELHHQPIGILYHIDLYRLESLEEIKGIGIDDILSDEQAVTLIEWAERMENLLPKKRIDIHIRNRGEEGREISISQI